jgi:hypothetical protein
LTPVGGRVNHYGMPSDDRCANCENDIGPGSTRFIGRQRLADGTFLCDECAHIGSLDLDRADVPVQMPNSNLPNTH